jgi:hypothetical protein
VFTAQYALSPYIKHIHFVFKGLNDLLGATEQLNKIYNLIFDLSFPKLEYAILSKDLLLDFMLSLCPTFC